jgi:hypothetical protein
MKDFESEYEVWEWKQAYMLHWLINPGVALNELFLGQRVPKVLLIKEDPTKTLPEKSFVPCPHCGTIHPSLEWSSQNKTAFGNWFGLYCNECGKIIPCLRNFTSFIIIAIASPIWIWFEKKWKEKWLIKQKEKFSKPLKLSVPEYNVWLHGLKIGTGYYLLIMFTKFVVFQEPFTWKKPIGNFIGSILIGLVSASIIKELAFKRKSSVRKTSEFKS